MDDCRNGNKAQGRARATMVEIQVQTPDSFIDLIENSDFAYFFICVFTLICASGP